MTEIKLSYSPRKWQLGVHQSLKRFSVIVAHRGSGKDFLAMNELIKRAVTGPKNAEYCYLLPLQTQARKTVWDKIKRFAQPIPDTSFDNQNLVIRFLNNSKILLAGANDPDSLRGLHLHGLVLNEYDDMPIDLFDVVCRPMLTNNNGTCMIIGTPKGKRGLYRMYMRSQEPDREDWYGILLPWYKTDALPQAEIDEIRKSISPEAFAQELECSFESANVGAYYGKQIVDLREDHRIAHFDPPLYRPDLEVHTAWDLGIRDMTSVWWFQLVGNDIHFIDHESHANLGLKEWALILGNKPFAKNYGTHIAPHDIKVRELGTGVSRLESAEQLGIRFEQCPKQDIMDGIELVRRTLPKCRFDLARCSEGVDALAAYRAKIDKDNSPLAPLHDWSSHTADAMRYAITYVEQVMNAPILTRMSLRRR